MKKTILNFWPILLILILSSLITWPLFLPGYFSHHDDLQVMRIFEMRQCLSDFQIPCRWVPDMGYGNGFPLFNYYGPLPYYIGALFSLLFGYIVAAKFLFFLPLVLGGILMYFLGKEIFGKIPGLTCGILYLFAPYRALDSYARGAVSESFALAIIPLLLYFILRLIREKTLKNFLGTIVSMGLFLITHNIMTMLFMPVVIFFVIYFTFFESRRNLMAVTASLLLGVGISAFFLLPAYFEQSLVQTDTLTRFDLDFRVHFVTISQLFINRAWGYGASILGPADTLSFQIGWPHWWLVAGALFFVVREFLRKGKNTRKNLIFILLLLVIFIFSAFMTHNKSAFIWEKIGILRFAQFPWRFLSLTIFSAGLLGGYVTATLNGRFQKPVLVLILAATVIFNWIYFRPQNFYFDMTDQRKLSGTEWEIQQKASILDYLPKTALEPREGAPNVPIIVSGQAIVENFTKKSNSFEFNAGVGTVSNIEIPIYDFPNWRVQINGVDIDHTHKNFLGRIRLDLGPGQYIVTGRLTNTPVRTFSNVVSLLSFATVIFLVLYGKSKKFFK